MNEDGWCLDDAEQRQARAPTTFIIPPVEIRSNLLPGDLAQLTFLIAVDDQPEPEGERMWVIVRECVSGFYLGILDNEPSSIEENDNIWRGSEIPFESRHVIDAKPRNRASIALARQSPRRRWPLV